MERKKEKEGMKKKKSFASKTFPEDFEEQTKNQCAPPPPLFYLTPSKRFFLYI